MEDFTVAKRGDYLLVKIFCDSCGNEVLRTGKKGRPAKTCPTCKAEKAKAKVNTMKKVASEVLTAAGVEFRVNVSEPNETPNFVKVEGDEFWTAMAAKAVLRRQEQAQG